MDWATVILLIDPEYSVLFFSVDFYHTRFVRCFNNTQSMGITSSKREIQNVFGPARLL